MNFSRTTLIILGVIGVALLVFIIIFIFGGIGGNQQKNVTIQFWGPEDEASSFQTSIQNYENQNPGVYVTYRKLNPDTYEQELINAFASGNGPDIFMMHNTWLPKHADKIQPMPQNNKSLPSFTLQDFQNQFVDTTVFDLTVGDQIYALPIYVDTLGLYYNKDIFNSAGIAIPPVTWNDINDYVRQLTQYDQNGNITRSGLAMGTSGNIKNSAEILEMLMLQSGVKMTDDTYKHATFADPVNEKPVGENSLQYYTDFANAGKEVYSWNNQMPDSVDAFTQGQAAMIIGDSQTAYAIRAKAPRLNFSEAALPHIKNSSILVNLADYWAPTVSKQSQNGTEAWRFIIYLASQDGATPYLNASHRPTARRDLVDQQKVEADVGIFAAQALTARSWYQADKSAIDQIFNQAIQAANANPTGIRDILNTAQSRVSQLMQKQ